MNRVDKLEQKLVSWIVTKRKEMGLSQEYFAQLIGLDQTAVSKIELGKRRLSLTESLKALTSLGLDINEASELIKTLYQDN